MESVLRGILCVLVRADDILVNGCTDTEQLANVDEVHSRHSKAGLKAEGKNAE